MPLKLPANFMIFTLIGSVITDNQERGTVHGHGTVVVERIGESWPY